MNEPQIDKRDSVSMMSRLKHWFRHLLKLRVPFSLQESVAELIEEHDESGQSISLEERTMLRNVVSVGDTTIGDIMVPRGDIIAVNFEVSLDALKEAFLEEGHTRMPVYRDSLDNVVGFIHIKDLIPVLDKSESFSMETYMRQILVASPSMKVLDLLIKMRFARVHMAIVLDEYGGTDGLVTIEDLVEQIVGSIEDEHDDEYDLEIRPLSANSYEASARVKIQALETMFSTKITNEEEDHDCDTIGGLIFLIQGHVPVKGDVINHHSGIEFEIIDADPRHIKRVIIRKQA